MMLNFEESKPPIPFGRISPRTKITALSQLRKGDHVMEESPFGYWHHFIVEKVKPNFAWVIHKTGDHETGFRAVGESNPTSKAEVVRTKFVIEPGQVIYRVEYPEPNKDCTDSAQVVFSSHEVVRRARKRIGERNYNAFTSNCEHFCRDCKAGKPESYQAAYMLWTLGRLVLVMLQGVFGGVFFIIVTTSGFLAHTSVLFIGHIVGVIVGFIQDAVWVSYEVIMADNARTLGHVTPVDAERIKAKRVTPIVAGFVGGAGGAVLGYYHIPIPVLGSIIGAIAGNCFCQALGLVFGRWVSTLLK